MVVTYLFVVQGKISEKTIENKKKYVHNIGSGNQTPFVTLVTDVKVCYQCNNESTVTDVSVARSGGTY